MYSFSSSAPKSLSLIVQNMHLKATLDELVLAMDIELSEKQIIQTLLFIGENLDQVIHFYETNNSFDYKDHTVLLEQMLKFVDSNLVKVFSNKYTYAITIGGLMTLTYNEFVYRIPEIVKRIDTSSVKKSKKHLRLIK